MIQQLMKIAVVVIDVTFVWRMIVVFFKYSKRDPGIDA